jgi:hypothetical protein
VIGLALVMSMFKIVANPTFESAVQLSRPDADAPITVQVTWRHKGTRELSAWLDAAGAAGGDAEYLDQVIVSWGRVVDEDGKPVEYSRDALAVLLANFPSAGKELVQAYYRRLTDARGKN